MSLFSSLSIGSKSLTASQLGQSVTGHNIANVDTEGFSRQNVVQGPGRPHDGKVHGVDIMGVRRIQDGFAKKKVIAEQNQVGTWETKERILTEAEIIYTDLEGNRLRGQMDEFWGAWSSVANEPESVTMRKALLSKAENLTNGFKGFDNKLKDFRASMNVKINELVREVNQTTMGIADLNKQILHLESRELSANDQRDQREVLLQNLSELIDVRYFEDPANGSLEIQTTNGQSLVHGRTQFEMQGIMDADDTVNLRIGVIDEIGIVNDVTDQIQGGVMKEYIEQRDGNIKRYRDDMNEMIKELAFQVNRLHSTGSGLEASKYTEKGANSFDEVERSKPLPFLNSGPFTIKLVDEHNEISEEITVDVIAGEDTLEMVVDKINRAADAYEMVGEPPKEVMKEQTKLRAEIKEDGKVAITSGLGNRFIYGDDQAGAFTLIGLNCFFHYDRGAFDIRVNQDLLENELEIAVGKDLVPGDNSIATEISLLQGRTVMDGGTITFGQFYNNQVTDIGLKVQDSIKGVKSHTQMLEQYKSLRDSVSAVNLDEEMTNMVKYQRAYESSAKFLSTVDEMTQTVINM